MNALELRPNLFQFAPVRWLQTAGKHRGVHRDSVNEALGRHFNSCHIDTKSSFPIHIDHSVEKNVTSLCVQYTCFKH